MFRRFSSYVRALLLKDKVDETRTRLRHERVFAERLPYSPLGLRCTTNANISATAASMSTACSKLSVA